MSLLYRLSCTLSPLFSLSVFIVFSGCASTVLVFTCFQFFLCCCIVLQILSFPYVFHLLPHYWCFLDYYSSVSSNPYVLFTQSSSSLICSFETFQGFIYVSPEAAKLWGFLWFCHVFQSITTRDHIPHFSVLSSVQSVQFSHSVVSDSL